jgi:hypothetical protein
MSSQDNIDYDHNYDPYNYDTNLYGYNRRNADRDHHSTSNDDDNDTGSYGSRPDDHGKPDDHDSR